MVHAYTKRTSTHTHTQAMFRRLPFFFRTVRSPLGRWCHRTSEEYPHCDWKRKVDMANADNGSLVRGPKAASPVRVSDDVRAEELRMMMVVGTFV